MKDGWRTVTIGKLCDEGGGSVQTGPFGSQLHASDYVVDGIPFIMPANLGENKVIENDIARISNADYQRLAKYQLKQGDIIYGRRGDIGRRALITKREEGWMLGSGCLRIRFGDADVDPRYVSYYLGLPEVKQQVLGKAVGTTMPNLNSAIIRSVPLTLPPLPIQRRIASILGALDDKIECNRRINQTLEQMAQALYKHWFVDFAPFRGEGMVESELGEIPRGWEVKPIGEVVDTIGGGTPSTSNPDLWTNGQINWYVPSDLTRAKSLFVTESSKKINERGLAASAARLFPAYSVMLTSRATIGEIAINRVEATTNQGFIAIVPNEKISLYQIVFWLRENMEKIQANAHGTTFKEITSGIFRTFPILVAN